MTIETRNEVLVTCQDAPLMELLEHLEKDHAPDLDYCLENLGLDYTAANEPQEEAQTVRTPQDFIDLPIGAVVKIPADGTYYKITSNFWSIPRNVTNAIRWHTNEDMASFTISVNAPATVVFAPEVQE